MIQNSWDEKMVKLAHAGDREAEEALIQKYKPLVKKLSLIHI